MFNKSIQKINKIKAGVFICSLLAFAPQNKLVPSLAQINNSIQKIILLLSINLLKTIIKIFTL